MELKLNYKQLPIWQEQLLSGRFPISMEAVVPDRMEDAASVIWSKGGLLLKGKEPTANSCTFLGEAFASVLYQTEDGRLNMLRISKEFSWTMETGQIEADALPQILWRPTAVEAKLLNPRKIAVSMELSAQVRCFKKDTLPIEPELPAEEGSGLQLRRESSEASVLSQIREKAFSIREQMPLQEGQHAIRTIEGEQVRFPSMESEQLGARSVIKGEAELCVWGLSEEGLPSTLLFRIPFSQLIETEEEADRIEVWVQPSSLYLDWHEGLNGEPGLDAEIHAVAQLRQYKRVTLCAVTDAYSTKMPSSIQTMKRTSCCGREDLSAVLETDETVVVPEDVSELLSWEAVLGPLERDREHIGQSLAVSMLLRRSDGSLDGFSRKAHLQGDPLDENAYAEESVLKSCELVFNPGKVRVKAAATLKGKTIQVEETQIVCAVELKDEQSWDCGTLPSLSLVRRGGADLWDLAKEYRSSVEAIVSCNKEGSDLLLIPAL